MNIALKLLELRKNKGLSQEELATDLNISQSSISNYEKGTYKPDIETLLKYSRYFDVELGEFFKEDVYTFYNHENKNKGDINNMVINNLSEKVIEQFEKRIIDKEHLINLQKEIIFELKETINFLKQNTKYKKG